MLYVNCNLKMKNNIKNHLRFNRCRKEPAGSSPRLSEGRSSGREAAINPTPPPGVPARQQRKPACRNKHPTAALPPVGAPPGPSAFPGSLCLLPSPPWVGWTYHQLSPSRVLPVQMNTLYLSSCLAVTASRVPRLQRLPPNPWGRSSSQQLGCCYDSFSPRKP